MFKRYLVGLLLLLLVFLPQPLKAQGSEKVLELTLEKALELALASNQDVALAQLNVEAKRMAFREAEATADDLPVDIVTTYPLALQKYVVPRAAAMDLALAQRNAELAEKNIRLATEQQFYALLKARREVALKEAALTRAKELLAQIKEKVRVGAAAQVEVLAQEAAVAQAEAALESARAQAENVALDFKRTLNVDPGRTIELVGDFELPAPKVIPPDAVIEEALAASYSVLAAREGLAVAEVTFEQAKKFYTPNVFVYRENSYKLEAARVNLTKAEAEIRSAVMKNYNLLKAAAGGITALAKGVEQAQEALRLTKLRYEVGMATSLEVEQAADRLAEIEARLVAARYDYQALLTKLHYRLFDPIPARG